MSLFSCACVFSSAIRARRLLSVRRVACRRVVVCTAISTYRIRSSRLASPPRALVVGTVRHRRRCHSEIEVVGLAARFQCVRLALERDVHVLHVRWFDGTDNLHAGRIRDVRVLELDLHRCALDTAFFTCSRSIFSLTSGLLSNSSAIANTSSALNFKLFVWFTADSGVAATDFLQQVKPLPTPPPTPLSSSHHQRILTGVATDECRCSRELLFSPVRVRLLNCAWLHILVAGALFFERAL